MLHLKNYQWSKVEQVERKSILKPAPPPPPPVGGGGVEQWSRYRNGWWSKFAVERSLPRTHSNRGREQC